MPHIALPDAPGIRALFKFRGETAKPLCDLAEVLLRAPSSLSRGERELIAAFVSSRNGCRYCTGSHSAYAAAQLPGGAPLVNSVKADLATAEISAKLRALLTIAGQVQISGRAVTADAIAAARAEGATDVELHDTVLIAAAFCMYNRYVDGLGTIPLADESGYAAMAPRILEHGYVGIPIG
jgi:uncharacterized peroxidase-related enzyme